MAVLRTLVARRRFGPQTPWRPLRGTLASGLGLGNVSLAWPAVARLLAYSRICHEYSSLFIIVINLILVFALMR